MTGLKARLAGLERRGGRIARCGYWMPPMLSVEAGGEHEPEFEARLAAIRQEAKKAGWTPGCGRPCVIIVRLVAREEMPPGDEEALAEGQDANRNAGTLAVSI